MASPQLVQLEERCVPINFYDLLISSFDQGGPPVVRGIDADTGAELYRFQAFEKGFQGGVRVALGDVNGDDTDDLICAPGPGGKLLKGSRDVKIFDGNTRQLITSFRPYGHKFDKGFNVAAGDVNRDGLADVIVAPGGGSKPVHVYAAGKFDSLVQTYPAIEFIPGGVSVGAGDVNGDGADDVVTQSGSGRTSRIRVFDGATGDRFSGTLGGFNPFGPGVAGGAWVAAGDMNGDGKADLIAGTTEGKARLRVFDGASGTLLAKSSQAEAAGYVGGIRVATGDLDGDGLAEILTGTGKASGLSPHLQVLDGTSLSVTDTYFTDPTQVFRGGTTVACGIIAILIGL